MVQDTPQVGENPETSEHAASFLEETVTVGMDSKSRDELYFARAVENEGLTVDIVGLTKNIMYEPILILRNPTSGRGYSAVNRLASVPELTEEVFEPFKETTARILYVSIACLPHLTLYYQTPTGTVYSTELTQKTNTFSSKFQHYDFLTAINTAVASQSELTTVDDISPTNAIPAKLRPETGLDDGELHLGGTQIEITADEARVTSSTTSCQNILQFILDERNPAFSTLIREKTYASDWVWGYVSDIQETSTGDSVFIQVKTPIGSAVFPFEISHETDSNPLWTLVEHVGGDLCDIRGEDVCLRRRAPYAQLYKYNKVGDRNSETPDGRTELTATECKQPALPVTSEKGTVTVLMGDQSPVTPIAVDTDYIWTLGLPPHDQFTNEVVNQENKPSDDSRNTDIHSIVNSVTSIL